jgi:plastocyanin
VKAAALALLCASSAAYADASVRGVVEVTRPNGVPAGQVVVYIVGFAEQAPATALEVKQVNKRFIPELIAVTAGGTVSFPNGDPFLHNVFSPTSNRTFDLGSYKKGDTRTRTFPKPGVVDIFCNIHPEMSATLIVLPNTRYAIVDSTGRFQIDHVPAGTWTIFAFSRRAVQPVSAKLTVGAEGVVDVSFKLDEVQRDFTHPNKYGEKYRPTTIYPPGA